MKLELLNYNINEKEVVYESPKTIVLTAKRIIDNVSMVVKLFKDEYPSSSKIAAIKREFEITSLFNSNPHIVQSVLFEKISRNYVIVFKYLTGQSLGNYLNKKKLFENKEFLAIAIKIAIALGEIHKSHIVHNDINPANIIYDIANNQITIIDFGLAVSIPKEWTQVTNPNELQGTLPYISPEQTGRMNRGVDYRSDFYSLGVTFYQMITGQLPFSSTDSMELIHSHIAIIPKSPTEIIPSIPNTISSIIMKLMSKNAEDRYQSMTGLIHDLKYSLEQLETQKNLSFFKLGSKDISNYFQISEKLYGRSNEVEALLNAYDRVVKGKVELFLVTGPSGIGKSAIIQEIYKPIVKKSGYYASGKFEQFKHNIPYSALTQAFNKLISQILTESEDKISFYKKIILDSLGEQAQIIIDIIPKLALIIGDQPPVIELGPAETLNRFIQVFQNFITSLATEKHPITLFLDDLQWADIPSLNLIEILLSSFNCRYLLIIGAYRNNEVDNAHPLIAMLENLKKKNFIYETITLNPLKLEDVETLIADTLYQTKEAIIPLALLCYEKTGGNPFFLNQLLMTLHQEDLIKFDSSKNIWIWYLEKIQEKKISDNIVELIIDKFKKLTAHSQRTIQFGSCIGNQFTLTVLSNICNQNDEKIQSALLELTKEGFLIKRGGQESEQIFYQFVHDRIQQAAYLMVSDEEKIVIHLNIARLLLQQTNDAKLHEEIFNIVNHFNVAIEQSIPPFVDLNEKIVFSELNLKAAKLAKSASAYQPSLEYILMSLKCIENEFTWEKNYEQLFEIHLEATENAYLSSNYDLMNKYSDVALKHAKDIYDEVKINMIKIVVFSVQQKLDLSIETALNIIAKLGLKINPHPSLINVLSSIAKVKILMLGKKIPDLINLPVLNNKRIQALLHLLITVYSTAYQTDPNLFIVLVSEGVSLSLLYGNTKEFSYDGFGMISVLLGSINEGYQWGNLELSLLEKFREEKSKTRITFAIYTFIKHWKDPIKKDLIKLLQNFDTFTNSGDLEFAGFSLAFYYSGAICCGEAFMELLPKLEIHRTRFKKMKFRLIYDMLEITYQAFLNLEKEREIQGELGDISSFNESEWISVLNKNKEEASLFLIYFYKIMLNYFFEKYSEAMKYIELADTYEKAVRGSFIIPTYYFYKTLLLIEVYSTLSLKDKWKYGKVIRKTKKRIKKWADFCTENHLHRYYLLEAEWANKILHQKEKAEFFYYKSIELANKNKFLNDEAIANELLAKFYISLNNTKVAKLFIKEAHYCYQNWGAAAKVQQLEKKYVLYFSKEASTHLVTTSFSTSIQKTTSSFLDIESIHKFSQIISSTIHLTDLLNKLMKIVIENAGAQKCYLLLSKDGKFVIEAESGIDLQEAKLLQSIDVTNAILPVSIINYVIRTKEFVVLNSAIESDKFKDSYITNNNIESLLCLPLLNQGVLTGLLYMENNLLKGVFNDDRIEMLNMLSYQIAISIDNAKLHENTVRLNISYERFVPKDFISFLDKKSILEVSLGDHKEKEMSILFTDIRNFTARSETMSPEENFIFINSFLSVIAPIIRKHHGFIDKYIGDAIMALFPVSADDALKCAVEMQSSLAEYNKHHQEIDPIKIGIGINTGFLMLGTVGEEFRLGATVISDAVNIASRVESLTKVYDEEILITQNTYDKLQNTTYLDIQKVGNILVKGKSKEIIIYRVLN